MWMFFDSLLVASLLVSLLMGLHTIGGELFRARNADPFSGKHHAEAALTRHLDSLKSPGQRRLEVLRRQMPRRGRGRFYYRAVQVTLMFGSAALLLYRHG